MEDVLDRLFVLLISSMEKGDFPKLKTWSLTDGIHGGRWKDFGWELYMDLKKWKSFPATAYVTDVSLPDNNSKWSKHTSNIW